MKFGDKNFFTKNEEQKIPIPSFLDDGDFELLDNSIPRCTCSNCMDTCEVYCETNAECGMGCTCQYEGGQCTCSGQSNQCTCSGQSNQCTCSGQSNQGCSHDWETNHHESGASGCSSSGTSHPHPMHDKCRKCGVCRSSGTNAPWSWNYGNWYEISGGKHKRVLTCSRCSYQTSEEESHSTSTSYPSYDNSNHKIRTSCSKCSYSVESFESHSPYLGAQYEENGWYKRKCSRCGTGVLISQIPTCAHPNATWGSYYPNPSNALQCKRDKYCPASTCKKIVDTQTKSHRFVWNGQYMPHSETHHKKVGSCGDCSFGSLAQLESHSFVGGICVCGASSGGGGSTGTPSISSFTATATIDGMSIRCNVSATNAVRYYFNLYDATTTLLVATSGNTTSSSYTFSSMPETSYIVAVEAINGIGVVAKKSVNLTTPQAIPKEFKWNTPPQTGGEFAKTITSTEWERLQNTVNAWRKYYKLNIYQFVQHQDNDTSFTVAYKEADYTYRFFNQIISGISTIPKFNGSLPSKLTSNPRKWLANDFDKFQTAVNSLRNTVG